MPFVRVPASVAFARFCKEGATNAEVAWRETVVPERMVIALSVLEDPRWMMRGVCVAWRTVAEGRVSGTSAERSAALSRAIEDVLSACESWTAGGSLETNAVRARLDAIGAPHRHVAWGLGVALELVTAPDDPALHAPAVASVETAVDAADDLGADDRDRVRAELASALRGAIDPWPALAAVTRTFELPTDDHEDESPF